MILLRSLCCALLLSVPILAALTSPAIQKITITQRDQYATLEITEYPNVLPAFTPSLANPGAWSKPTSTF
jgi:hypothetical protein